MPILRDCLRLALIFVSLSPLKRIVHRCLRCRLGHCGSGGITSFGRGEDARGSGLGYLRHAHLFSRSRSVGGRRHWTCSGWRGRRSRVGLLVAWLTCLDWHPRCRCRLVCCAAGSATTCTACTCAVRAVVADLAVPRVHWWRWLTVCDAGASLAIPKFGRDGVRGRRGALVSVISARYKVHQVNDHDRPGLCSPGQTSSRPLLLAVPPSPPHSLAMSRSAPHRQ